MNDFFKPGFIELPSLPWGKDALAPHVSANTINFHYGKHHAGYVNKLKAAVEASPALQSKSVVDMIMSEDGKVYNLAAQHWNHSFYWLCMSPNGGGKPSGDLADAITKDFGSYEAFKEKFSASASGHFGSGWAWLCLNKEGNLSVVDTHDAANPMRDGLHPIMTCDVWEHAYYLDYQNNRDGYVEAYWSLVNWSFIEARYRDAKMSSNL